MANLEVRGKYLFLMLNPFEKLAALRLTNPKVLTKYVRHIGQADRIWSEVLEPERKSPKARPLRIGIREDYTGFRQYRTILISTFSFAAGRGRAALAVRGDSPGVFVDIREEATWQLFAITTARAKDLAEELRAKIGPRTR